MMRFIVTILMALRALLRNTMRSILTALGIIIGVGAVIAMVSIGNGAKAQVQNAIAGLGLGETIATASGGLVRAIVGGTVNSAAIPTAT